MPRIKRLFYNFLLSVLFIYQAQYLYAYEASLANLPQTLDVCLSDEEQKLARLIHHYRQQHALPAPPITRSLTQVATLHVRDLHDHFAVTNHPNLGGACSLHSWSAAGRWSPVCYAPDQASAAAMWNKPREITANRYTGNGYELAYWSAMPAIASRILNGWHQSPRHQAVLLETSGWQGKRWPAMGIGIYGHFAAVWFGDRPDPQGLALPCSAPAAARPATPTFTSPVVSTMTVPQASAKLNLP